MRCMFAILLAALVIASPASAQNFNGRYEGNLLLTRDGGECGSKSEKFQAEIRGKTVRITSQRMERPLEGEIRADGQFLVSGAGSGNSTLEWRAQILSTKTGLGTLLLRRGDSFCQFLLSLKLS